MIAYRNLYKVGTCLYWTPIWFATGDRSEFWCSMYYNVHADKYCSDLLLLYWYYNNHRYTDRFFDTWVMYWWSCINIRLLYCICIYISLPKMDQFLCRSEIVHLIFMVMLKTESLIYILTKHFNEIFHLHKILIYMIIILKMFLQINLIWLTHFDNNENI